MASLLRNAKRGAPGETNACRRERLRARETELAGVRDEAVENQLPGSNE
jgi:hypothetical protein